MKKFETVKIGEKARLEHIISQSDLDSFVKITGDTNKLHVSEDFASKTILRKPVVHGMLTASFISTVIGLKLPGHGALWYSQKLDFLLPVRIGDKIIVEATVEKKIKTSNSIEISILIFNQKKQLVTRGTVGVKLLSNIKIIKKNNTKIEQTFKIKRNKKLALIIGSSGGIGKATCLELAKNGFDIAIHYYKNYKNALKISKEIKKIGKKSTIVQFDSTDIKKVKKEINLLIKKFSSIDVIVDCSTSELYNIKFDKLDWLDIQKQIDVSLRGLFNVLSSALPTMKKNKSGNIICFSSQYVDSPKPELTHYTIAKSALTGFIKSFALENAPFGIRANIISPGMTETDLIIDVPEKVKLVTAAQTPLRRLANPADISGVVSFLASKKSSFLTGETIRVNGGQIML